MSNIETVGNALGFIGSKTDPMQKASKVVIAILAIVEGIFRCFPVLELIAEGLCILKGRLSDFKNIVSAAGFLQRTKEWVVEKERKKIALYITKLISRITLTVAQLMEAVWFFFTVKLIDLGKVAAFKIGNLPVFVLIKSALYATSAIFAIAYSCKQISEAKATYSTKALRLKFWEKRKWELQRIDPESEESTAAEVVRFLEKYRAKIAAERAETGAVRDVKIEKWSRYVTLLETSDTAVQQFSSFKCEKIRNRYTKIISVEQSSEGEITQGLLDSIQSILPRFDGENSTASLENFQDFVKGHIIAGREAKGLATESYEANVSHWVDYKIELVTEKMNNAVRKEKSNKWSNLANGVKIIIIAASLLLAAFSPVGAAILMAFNCLSLLVNSIQLGKVLYLEFPGKGRALPEYQPLLIEESLN